MVLQEQTYGSHRLAKLLGISKKTAYNWRYEQDVIPQKYVGDNGRLQVPKSTVRAYMTLSDMADGPTKRAKTRSLGGMIRSYHSDPSFKIMVDRLSR